jgi:ParB-like chromosome segregation protein Spo0J
MKDYRAHPAAEVFPMLDDERTKTMADDIKARGLRSPVVIWRDEQGEEWLLDGRNRVRACKMAGVAPTITYYDGEDPCGEVWSRNGERRDIIEPGRRAAIKVLLDTMSGDLRRAKAERLGRKAHGETAPGRPKNASGNVAGSDARANETRAALARDAKVSPRTAQKALTVGAEDSALLKRVADGEVSLEKASRDIGRRKVQEQLKSKGGTMNVSSALSADDKKVIAAVATAREASVKIGHMLCHIEKLQSIPVDVIERLHAIHARVTTIIKERGK